MAARASSADDDRSSAADGSSSIEPRPEVLAALDMGTNSFHLVLARVRGSSFEVVTREKETIRLGHGGGDMKELAPDAMDRGIQALKRMKQLADRHGATVRAV